MKKNEDANQIWDIASLQAEAAQLRRHIDALKKQLIDLQGSLTMADEILFIRRQQLDGLMYELAQRDQVINKILNSWFWRLTLPPQMPKRESVGVRRLLRLDRPGRGPMDSPVVGDPPISRRSQYVRRAMDRLDVTKLEIKAVAFYTPKLGSIHARYDAGVDTVAEWIRIANGLPRYLGHTQPHVADLGCYDRGEPKF